MVDSAFPTSSDCRAIAGNIDWELGIVHCEATRGHAAERFRHALAALALHGQPFGFTWADVDLLCWISESDYATTNNTDDVRSLRDRIAALLPPRTSESDAIADAFIEAHPDADAIIESVLHGRWHSSEPASEDTRPEVA